MRRFVLSIVLVWLCAGTVSAASPAQARTSQQQTLSTLQIPAQPLDIAAQAAALLPQAQSDLAQANAWNRYTISATIDPQARTISGHAQLEYVNHDTAALDRMYFHLYPNLRDFGGRLSVSSVQVDGLAVPVTYESGTYLLRVNLPQPLAPGLTTTLQLDFAARTPLNASRTRYGAFNEEGGVLALASAYPIAAIVRNGVWDIGRPDPKGDFVNSETALYDVTLTAPSAWTLATTGVPIDIQASENQRTTRFVSGPQRDFTIALTQLARRQAEVAGTQITSYFRSNNAAGGQLALDTAVHAMRVYNARYGQYPLRELDILEIDARQFYGVEYPGIVMIDAGLYGRAQLLEQTVAHEVAHQWWYSQVGNNVQTEAWLDEALASYSQVIYQEEIHSAAGAQRELDQFRQRYRAARAAGRDAPVEQATSAFGSNYFQIVYGKAALFFQALRQQIGEVAFDRFLHSYYAQHRYGYVSSNDLLANAEGACTCQLDDFYANWILRTVPLKVP